MAVNIKKLHTQKCEDRKYKYDIFFKLDSAYRKVIQAINWNERPK